MKRYDFSRIEETKSPIRILCWKTAVAITLDHPIFGIGPNSFYARDKLEAWGNTAPEDRESHYNWKWYNDSEVSLLNPHSDFLMILAEYGIFGFLLVIMVFGKIFKKITSPIINRYSDKNYYLLFSIIIGIVLFLLLCTMNPFLMLNSRTATFFWIYVGLALSLARNFYKNCHVTRPYNLKIAINALVLRRNHNWI